MDNPEDQGQSIPVGTTEAATTANAHLAIRILLPTSSGVDAGDTARFDVKTQWIQLLDMSYKPLSRMLGLRKMEAFKKPVLHPGF